MAGSEEKARPLARVAVVVAVALLAFVGYRLARGPAEDTTDTGAASRVEGEARRGGDREEWGDDDGPDDDADRVAAYDPARLAPLLLDGGSAPATLEALDRRLAGSASSPDEAPAAVAPTAPSTDEAAASPVSTAAIVEWHREPTVESDLRRAVFLRGLLDGQIDAVRERAAAARARGDEAAAARFERGLERLTRERPAVEARVAELEAEAEAAAGEETPLEGQGSF